MVKKAKEDADNDSGEMVATVRELASIVTDHNLSELVVEMRGATVTLRRGGAMPVQLSQAMPMPMPIQPAAPAAPSAFAATPTLVVDDKAHLVTSPFVGTFYRKPNPDSPNYVAMNDKIDKGAVLCIVEAMKLMNEIEADVAGTIVGILVEDGASVEYGQPLFKLAV
jgi:acetyl-CoA carboxylase biotin carboxyl carrier protein